MDNTKVRQVSSSLCLIIAFCFFSIEVHGASISLADREEKLLSQGDIVVRELDSDKREGKTFEVLGRISASRETLLQILTNYESYPEFMPNVSRIEVVEHRGHESILNYTLALPLGKIKKYRLKISVTEPETQHSSVGWQLQGWPGLKTEETIKDTNGYWLIEEKGLNSSLVLYHVYTDPGPIPFGLGWIVDHLSKDSVPETFLRTKTRAEESAYAKTPGTGRI